MIAVLVALSLGVFLGLIVRPILDAYLAFKTMEQNRDRVAQRGRHRSRVS